MDAEEWNEDCSETFAGKCERCGRLAPLQWVHDPFEAEGISEDTGTVEAWCYPCFDLRKNDV
jgi:hypothetical protein